MASANRIRKGSLTAPFFYFGTISGGMIPFFLVLKKVNEIFLFVAILLYMYKKLSVYLHRFIHILILFIKLFLKANSRANCEVRSLFFCVYKLIDAYLPRQASIVYLMKNN